MKRLFLVLALLAPAACRKDAVETRRVPKEGSAAAPMSAAGGAPGGVHWKLPPGWKELAGNGMRAATFRLPQAAGKAEVSVVVLPGDVGGELANVNRWRGQLALPPVTEDGLADGRATVDSALGPIFVYDFTGGGEKKTRLCAGMARVSGTTWFFKLMGDDKAVAAAKPAFLKLLVGLTN